ncbi:MAG TPA: hypothetical protein VF303_00320 [Candidatus Nanoarchaeia archaeon]
MASFKPARVPIWEKTKIEKRRGRLVKLAIFIVAALILTNLVIKLPGIYRDLNNPFPRFPDEKQKTSELDTSFRTNYLLISYEGNWLQDAAIASYEPEDGRLTLLLFNLPEDKKLRLAANKIFRGGGVEELAQYFGVSLGIVFDRYLAFESEDTYFTAEKALDTHKQLKSTSVVFKIFGLKQELDNVLKTNMSLSELLGLGWELRSTEFEEGDIVSLSSAGSTNLQSEEVASLVNSLFFDRRVIDEAAAVTIRNSSGVAGAGNTLAGILTNLGATVVVVETDGEVSEETLLVVRNKKPTVVKRMSYIFEFKRTASKGEEFSGDILIDLGKEAAGDLTLP